MLVPCHPLTTHFLGKSIVISYIVHLLRIFYFSGRGCRCGSELKSSCFVCWAYGDSQATSGDRRLVMSDAASGFESQINCWNCCALGSQRVQAKGFLNVNQLLRGGRLSWKVATTTVDCPMLGIGYQASSSCGWECDITRQGQGAGVVHAGRSGWVQLQWTWCRVYGSVNSPDEATGWVVRE
jgi:hypothetical protein